MEGWESVRIEKMRVLQEDYLTYLRECGKSQKVWKNTFKCGMMHNIANSFRENWSCLLFQPKPALRLSGVPCRKGCKSRKGRCKGATTMNFPVLIQMSRSSV